MDQGYHHPVTRYNDPLSNIRKILPEYPYLECASCWWPGENRGGEVYELEREAPSFWVSVVFTCWQCSYTSKSSSRHVSLRWLYTCKPPVLKVAIFHFSSESIAKLKEKANKATGNNRTISSFQALSGLVWRCITRARGFPKTDLVTCHLTFDNRARLQPPCSPNYYGNNLTAVVSYATVGEILTNDLGWIGELLKKKAVAQTDGPIRESVVQWLNNRDKLMMVHSSMFQPISLD
ncbi:hypothetical protein ZOSMA_5G00010 [Zostera marina]|uniref:Uncharacterized protein n=1 Tax=Zostera marina TaxID=29655 RepID=A0A0K9NVR4_ZOSMR|nr:hypothetical protein ZOSMA_5G00010 [Zostera marina]